MPKSGLTSEAKLSGRLDVQASSLGVTEDAYDGVIRSLPGIRTQPSSMSRQNSRTNFSKDSARSTGTPSAWQKRKTGPPVALLEDMAMRADGHGLSQVSIGGVFHISCIASSRLSVSCDVPKYLNCCDSNRRNLYRQCLCEEPWQTRCQRSWSFHIWSSKGSPDKIYVRSMIDRCTSRAWFVSENVWGRERRYILLFYHFSLQDFCGSEEVAYSCMLGILWMQRSSC